MRSTRRTIWWNVGVIALVLFVYGYAIFRLEIQQWLLQAYLTNYGAGFGALRRTMIMLLTQYPPLVIATAAIAIGLRAKNEVAWIVLGVALLLGLQGIKSAQAFGNPSTVQLLLSIQGWSLWGVPLAFLTTIAVRRVKKMIVKQRQP